MAPGWQPRISDPLKDALAKEMQIRNEVVIESNCIFYGRDYIFLQIKFSNKILFAFSQNLPFQIDFSEKLWKPAWLSGRKV